MKNIVLPVILLIAGFVGGYFLNPCEVDPEPPSEVIDSLEVLVTEKDHEYSVLLTAYLDIGSKYDSLNQKRIRDLANARPNAERTLDGAGLDTLYSILASPE